MILPSQAPPLDDSELPGDPGCYFQNFPHPLVPEQLDPPQLWRKAHLLLSVPDPPVSIHYSWGMDAAPLRPANSTGWFEYGHFLIFDFVGRNRTFSFHLENWHIVFRVDGRRRTLAPGKPFYLRTDNGKETIIASVKR